MCLNVIKVRRHCVNVCLNVIKVRRQCVNVCLNVIEVRRQCSRRIGRTGAIPELSSCVDNNMVNKHVVVMSHGLI